LADLNRSRGNLIDIQADQLPDINQSKIDLNNARADNLQSEGEFRKKVQDIKGQIVALREKELETKVAAMEQAPEKAANKETAKRYAAKIGGIEKAMGEVAKAVADPMLSNEAKAMYLNMLRAHDDSITPDMSLEEAHAHAMQTVQTMRKRLDALSNGRKFTASDTTGDAAPSKPKPLPPRDQLVDGEVYDVKGKAMRFNKAKGYFEEVQ
jgi:hypothetical protein